MTNNNTPERCWINQPSTFDIMHEYHGVNVLAIKEDELYSRIYFLSGPTISARIPTVALSNGWKENRLDKLRFS